MRSLFATILAISASTSALPAIANPITNPISSQISKSSIPAENQSSSSNQFRQRSLNFAKQIPADAIGIVLVDLDANSWQISGMPQSISPVSAFDKLLTFLGQSLPISIAKDIQPWLGKEVAIAFFSNTDNKFEFTFTALSTVADDKKFEIFLKKLKSLDLPKPTETLYQNVKILEWQLEEDSVGDKKPVISHTLNSRNSLQSLLRLKQDIPPNTNDQEEESDESEPIVPSFPNFSIKRFAIAKLPSGIAVITTDRQMIQKMIDTSAEIPEQRLASLADNQLFLRSLNNPLWNRSLIAGYGDFKELGKISELLAADLPETSEIPGFSRQEYLDGLNYTLAQYSSFDLFTWVTPQGIRSQSNSYFSEVRSPSPKDTATRDRLLSYLPSNVYGAITSRNLNRQWQWFVEESKQQSTYKILVEGVRMLAPLIVGSGLDLDIEKDIISWIDGEYAVVVFPSDHSPFQETGVDLTIGALIRTSKPDVANATLGKLTQQISKLSRDFIQVKKRQIGTTVLTSFEFPDTRVSGKTQSIFAYGWRDRQTLMLTLGANTASAFVPIPKPALAESEMFRDAITDMPQPNFGYFYLNVNAIAKQVAKFYISFSETFASLDEPNQVSKPEIPEVIQKTIDRLGGAVFVYSETSDRFQSDFFLGLKP
ncbi:DUF3352 domain-containing protein [Pseudanabaena sp. BC1403]|uniref:DUF3352 domain-containing protein n=1 Tax=Pseudanabaena sp. BC1403 TaxID=2043171 RepID=UPI000CD9F162|nr:DUF3352 domain-containing protein [Pseudanabaena sp. BC1403]